MSLARIQNQSIVRGQALIGGEWVESRSRQSYEVANPANKEPIARLPLMGGQDAKEAIEKAAEALPDWRQLTAKERSVLLRRWYELQMEHQEDLALLITLEQGKPLAEARAEVAYAASFVEWYAEEGKRVYGDVIPTHRRHNRLLTLKQPVGVVAAITPWNFPAAMVTRKVAPALAAGCTVVCKPSEATPLTGLALAFLAQKAGIPAGVLNIISGDAEEIGAAFTSSSAVQQISFTGSTRVGRLLMEQCSSTVKRLSLELGGQAPFIVFEDADIDQAIQGALACKYRNNGQTCVCANRFLVQDSIYEQFSEKLVQASEQMQVGNGLEDGSQLGPLINEAAVQKVKRHLEDALQKGATILTGGKPHAKGGNFFEPTVVGNADHSMLLAQEETFGPVSPLFRFRTEEEALQMANDTDYGLAAYFYARDIGRVWRVSEALEYGIVGINEGIVSTENVPFGGWKQSGLGREGCYQGIEEYLEIKYICMGGI